MKRFNPVLGCLFALILAAGIAPQASAKAADSEEDGAAVYDIPFMNDIVIDGNSADWKSGGFRVELMADASGQTQPESNLKPSLRLGWNEHGLLALVQVRDDAFAESGEEENLADNDSLEIYVSSKPGARDLYGIVIAPGMAPDHPQLRAKIENIQQQERRNPLTYEAARGKLDNGYLVEMLLPWSNFDIKRREGDNLGFQLIVNDVDAQGTRFQAMWNPQGSARNNNKALAWLRLARQPSPPVRTRVWGEYDDAARIHVNVLSLDEFAGKSVAVQKGRKRYAQANLIEADGYARAELRFPMPMQEDGQPWHVCAGRAFDVPVDLPRADIIRAQRIMLLTMAAKPPVFKGDIFPACDFAEPLLAERLIGPYRIKTTFYDREFRAVTYPGAPGRYGAVLEIHPETGRFFRRYLTLFRAPENFDTLFSWWCLDPNLAMRLPSFAVQQPSEVQAQAESLGAYVKGKILDDLYKGQEAAVLFAGLYENTPGDKTVNVTDDVWAADRQWWVTLKRKLNGMEADYPNPFVCPYAKEGEPAPMLKKGSEQEAGMKPGTETAIDAVCQDWIKESGEPFAVCVARHGVVFFHKAYGERYGEPMTVDTKSWMASISKFLSGVLMMTVVDQGLVDIDGPVDQYLPSFRDIPVKYPLTIRHLYTHTSGLGLGLQPPRMYIDHWGDERNDFEELVAGYYPFLDVGGSHRYNGAGHALGGKIIESMTGEALPQCFYRHLWGPLGCENTDAMDGSAHTMSAPLDIAKFGQMLLNKGAYGNMRFFREETFEKMLPAKLAPYVHFETNLEWGIGPVWTREPGLSERTFGHGAASSATLRIDPENDLIIVMTRNTAGPAWGKYHPQFIHAISEGLNK